MNSRSSSLPVQMARRVSRRLAQCIATAAAGFIMVSLIGCGIVRQSFEMIAAKAAVLTEIGVQSLVNPSHFLERGFGQNLMAGSFFGVTIGLAAGVGIFFACVLIESLPYRKLKSACIVILCLLLAYLSHQVFRIAPGAWGLLVWLFPAAAAAVCEAVSPTPAWRSSFLPAEPGSEETRGVRPKVNLLIVFSITAAVAAVILWSVQSAPILRYGAARKNFFAYFRDDILLGSAPGAALDRFYYKHSPYSAEFVPPTQFQPVIIAACGLSAETTNFIPRYYTTSLLPVRTVIPVYTVPMHDIETAMNRFASGAFDVMVIQPSSLGMTPEDTEELLEARGDLPDNWRVRCVIIAGRRQSTVPNAIGRSLRNMTATDLSGSIRNMVYFSFTRPLLRIFEQPLFPAGFLTVVLWITLLIAAWSARGTAWPVVSVVVSTFFAAALWWIVIAGWTERAALADTLIRLDGPMPSAKEEKELLSSKSAAARYAVLRYLTARHDTAHVERVLNLSADPDPRVRVWAVHLVGKALKRTGSQSLRWQILPRILDALQDESFHVRYAAAEVTASAGLYEAEPELLNLIRENRHLYVTWYAVNALHRMHAESEMQKP